MVLAPGQKAELTVVVDQGMTADQLGNPGVDVFGTPALVRYFEATAIKLLEPHLESGEGSVGTYLNLHHRAATPVGMQITFSATVTAVDGRRLRFRLEARDDKELVAEADHERFRVDMAKFLVRSRAKATEVGKNGRS